MCGVIDRDSFVNIRNYIEHARNAATTATDGASVQIIAGGGTDDSVGYFVEPTIIQTADPNYKSLCEVCRPSLRRCRPWSQRRGSALCACMCVGGCVCVC